MLGFHFWILPNPMTWNSLSLWAPDMALPHGDRCGHTYRQCGQVRSSQCRVGEAAHGCGRCVQEAAWF